MRFDHQQLRNSVATDPFWARYLADVDNLATGVHLGVFSEPFLSYVLAGTKTIESRFSISRVPPFGVVEPGDIVLIKASGGPIKGLCQITDVWQYRLTADTWRDILGRFGPDMCLRADDAFVAAHRGAAFATLMRLQNPRSMQVIETTKRDRRGWVVLRRSGARSLWADGVVAAW